MKQKFSDVYVGKTKEEIFQEKKEYYERYLRYFIESAKESFEFRKKNNTPISHMDYDLVDCCVKSLENIDETTIATMREEAAELYSIVERLNESRRRDPYYESKPSFKLDMMDIAYIVDGFGKKSEDLYQNIANNKSFNPEMALWAYKEMVGIDAISPKKAVEIIESLGTKYDETTIRQRVDIEEKAAFNCRKGVLKYTRDERIQQLAHAYGVNIGHTR